MSFPPLGAEERTMLLISGLSFCISVAFHWSIFAYSSSSLETKGVRSSSAEHRSRIASTVHATTVALLSGLFCLLRPFSWFDGPLMLHGTGFSTPEYTFVRALVAWTAGYFVSDFCVMLLEPSVFEMTGVVHHMLICPFFIAGIVLNTGTPVHFVFLLEEASTPLLNWRWFLIQIEKRRQQQLQQTPLAARAAAAGDADAASDAASLELQPPPTQPLAVEAGAAAAASLLKRVNHLFAALFIAIRGVGGSILAYAVVVDGFDELVAPFSPWATAPLPLSLTTAWLAHGCFQITACLLTRVLNAFWIAEILKMALGAGKRKIKTVEEGSPISKKKD